MASALNSRRSVDDALRSVFSIAGSTGTSRRRQNRKRQSWWVSILRWLGPPLLFAVLPFLVLLRGATVLYAVTALPVWLCVACAALASGLIIFACTVWLVRRIGASVPRYALRFSVVLASAYCAFGLLYVSADNVKRPEIRATYNALHPLLRLSVSTLVLVDSGQVITDSERVAEDYTQMGLDVNPSSLHYRQPDGYVYAVDLRTVGRSEVANVLSTWYFRGLGFSVLRHTGTADHLHVSLRERTTRR